MLDTLKSLLTEQVKDLYSAENQLLKALPRMAKAASSAKLKSAFESHLEETRGHVDRLTQVAQLLETKPGGKKCKAMEGLIEEGKEVLEEDGESSLIDLALITAAQKVEHYEIAGYGTARAIAQQLGEHEIVKLLEATLGEEEAADKKLTQVTKSDVMPDAMHTGTAEPDGTQGTNKKLGTTPR